MIVPLTVFAKDGGDPMPGAAGAFSFVYFKRRNNDGTIDTLSDPAFVEKTGGGYEFAIQDSDLNAGSIISYLIDFGTDAASRYEFDHVAADTHSVNVVLFFFFSVTTGDPVTGTIADFSAYSRRNTDASITNLFSSRPSILDHGNLLYEFVIDPATRPDGTQIDYILDATAAVAGRYFSGNVSDEASAVVDTSPPTISNVVPADGSKIFANVPIGFDVTDPTGNLEDVKLHVYYPSLGVFEVAWYGAISGSWGARGEGFAPKYTGTRSAISNGFRFASMIRIGGWPAPPVIVPEAVDASGNEL